MMRLVLVALLVSVPALAQPAPRESRTEILERLFSMLQVAPDEHSAGQLESAIQTQWVAAATPAVKLLLLDGIRQLNEDRPQDALDDMDAALDLQPELIEAWRGRALARAGLGDTSGAEHDIAETIKREPRQFEALKDLSHIAEQAGNWKGAYAAWSQVLAIDPMAPGGVARLADLKRRAFGDDL